MKIETIVHRGFNIDIYEDEYAESPNSWGNEDMFIVYDHRDFYVNRKEFNPCDIFDIFQTKNIYNGYHIFPLYAYIHSEVSLSLGRDNYPFNDRWDVSSTGFVLVKRLKGWSWTREKAYSCAESLIEEWNQYLHGEVYGYKSSIESCLGFYGEEGKEEAITQAKAEIDYYIEEKNKEILLKHLSKLKIQLKNHVPLSHREPLILENV